MTEVDSGTRKVQQSSLITAVAVSLLGLTWKLFKLPISVFGGSLGLVTGSVRLSFWVAGSVLSFWLSFLRLNRSRRNPKPSSTPQDSVSVLAAAKEPDAVDFLSEFESRYGKLHPNFVPGDFMDAVERSRREYKLLFVYLHSPEHPDTPSFCRNTLCSEVLSAFVDENFVAWGESIRQKQGLDISKSLKASRFPFWAVIETVTSESFSLLRQFEGPSSPEEMVTELQSVLQDNVPAVVAGRLDTDEHSSNTPLMEEQDAALEAPTLVAGKIDTDEDTNNTPLTEEQDAALPVAIEAPVAGILDTDEDTNTPLTEEQDAALPVATEAPVAGILDTDEDTNTPLTEEQDAALPVAIEAPVVAILDTHEDTNNTPLTEEQDAAFPVAIEHPVAGILDTDEDTNNTPLMDEQDAALEADQPNEGQMSEDQNEIDTEIESEAKLYKEEASTLVAEPEQGPDVIQVFVRLPTGERIGTEFPVTATLQSIYDFVDSSGCLDIGSYTLVTFFPRVLYGQDQLSTTIEELQLHPLTSLFVELNS